MHTSIPGGGGMATDGGGPLSWGGGGAKVGALSPPIGGPDTSIPGGITTAPVVETVEGTDIDVGRTVGAVPGGGATILWNKKKPHTGWQIIIHTAVSSAKVAVVDSGEVGRSAVYSRYNNGPRM
jgi:hypothetical protein